MREVIHRQHKALAPEQTYVHCLRRSIGALQGMRITPTSEQKLERFLTELALRRDVAASTQNQAFNAIAFFSEHVLGTPLHNMDALRVTRPVHLRHASTVTETRALLQAVRDVGRSPTDLLARLLYGCRVRSGSQRRQGLCVRMER